MNLDSRSVATPSGFRQTPRIALGKRTRFDESLKDQIAGRCNRIRRRSRRHVLFWLRNCGMREGQAAKHAFSRRAAVRITRGGPDRILVGHSSSRSRRVDPSGRSDAARYEPGVEITIGDADFPDAEPNDWRSLPDARQALEVSDAHAAATGCFLLRDDGRHLKHSFVECRQSALRGRVGR
jgi:hypothetical protein